MKITLADTAGFCFGVDKACKTVDELLKNGEKVCTLGPLIHNPGFIEDLRKRGVNVVNTPEENLIGHTLIIRTHGIPLETENKILSSGIKYCDVTCPFVKKIHRIAAEKSADGDILLIAGDKNHPEVKGIFSHVKTKYFVFSDAEELNLIYSETENEQNMSFSMVAQTTFDAEEYKKCKKLAKKLYTNMKIFDTICSATAQRQEEAKKLSAENDMMIVIGGRNSSNTLKLFNICREKSQAYLIEDAAELSALKFNGVRSIGVTAGASTPDSTIKEVITTMSEIIETTGTVAETAGQAEAIAEPGEMSFEQALEESLSSMNNDQKVIGTVMHIAPNEIQVDIGRKQTGYIPITEYSADPMVDPSQELKVGDELNLIIMKTNDVEGTIMLSKRRYDAVKYWDTVVEASKNGTILEGTVVEVISKGLIVLTNGIRLFIPASLSTVPRDGRLEEMLNKTVNFTVVDIDKRRRRAVGSIRDAAKAVRKENRDAFWAKVEAGEVTEGTVFTGAVKSLTDYGAFVELTPGVEGMVFRTELSWKRVKHPSDIVSIGDVIDVTVKGIDTEKKKIALTYKKLEDNPWEILKRDYPVGSVVTVKIMRITTFGAFAEIFPRMEGLIHISQIANERIEKPQDVLSIDQEVQAKIIDIDFERKRISLSIKALLPAPEKAVEEKSEEAAYNDAPVTMSLDEMIAKANEAEAAE